MAIERAEHPSHLPHIPTPDIGKAFAWIKNHPTATASITALVGVPAVAIFMYISRDKGPQHPVQTADSGNVLTVPLPALEPGVVSVETATATTEATPQCGYVRINSSVGLIQMRAPRSVLDEADEIIQRVQDIASRRLLLEARVLAVSRSRNFNQQANLKLGRTDDGTTTATSFNGSVTAALSNALATFTGSNLSTVGGITVKNNNLDAVIALLESYGTTYE
ncbi:MAG: hypothetical protein UT77_C0006G0001, partial [Candidatus Daviesbacteria bacterium GW2011_GWC2_40_12]